MSRLRFACRHRYPSGFELNADFSCGDGVTSLFGPSGSGKSTILSLIAGVIRPDSGTISLGARELTRLAPEQRGLGVIFQDQRLFPHLTVRANLQYGQRRRPQRQLDFGRVVEILEIGSLLDRAPGSLSGGQRQRVALGRALLRGPEMLLMDEPLAALDESLKERILTYLERVLTEWKLPTLFISHDPAEVQRLAQDVIVIESGRVVEAGPTEKTLVHALLSGLKEPRAPVNFLRVVDVKQVEGHWQGRVGEQRLYLPSPGAFVQFQPRDVTLSTGDLSGLSTRNHLKGTVREAAPLAERVFVGVDIGQLLWAEVTLEAARELDLRPGHEVFCHVKVSALEVLT